MKDYKSGSPSWAKFPAEIKESGGIELTEAVLYGQILNLNENGCECFSSNDYLAELCKIKVRHLIRLITFLEDIGLVKRENRRRNERTKQTDRFLKAVKPWEKNPDWRFTAEDRATHFNKRKRTKSKAPRPSNNGAHPPVTDDTLPLSSTPPSPCHR